MAKPKELTDEELVIKFQNGDHQAFNELIERYYEYVLSFYLHKGLRNEDAEDYTQHTFVKLLDKLSEFRFESKFKTYLYLIMRNQVYDIYRKRDRRVLLSIEANYCSDEKGEQKLLQRIKNLNIRDPLEDLEKDEFWTIVDRCLQAIPNVKIRTVIALKISGLTLREIASLISVTLGYANAMWTKNKMKFWKCIERHYGNEA